VLEDEEDASEGLLYNADEVATKLDLARAYMDMGDPDGARSILDEVMHEGSEEQKREAEDIISELA
jgi:pilus assembly protein FimV